MTMSLSRSAQWDQQEHTFFNGVLLLRPGVAAPATRRLCKLLQAPRLHRPRKVPARAREREASTLTCSDETGSKGKIKFNWYRTST